MIYLLFKKKLKKTIRIDDDKPMPIPYQGIANLNDTQ
jgi:hypothetical protein